MAIMDLKGIMEDMQTEEGMGMGMGMDMDMGMGMGMVETGMETTECRDNLSCSQLQKYVSMLVVTVASPLAPLIIHYRLYQVYL